MVSENVPIIGQGIRTLLLANSDITNLVGTKIFPLLAPENTQEPFIIYEDRNATPISTKDGTYERDWVELFVFACANSYENAKTLGKYIRQSLNGYSGTPVTGVTIANILYRETLVPELEERISLHMDKQHFRVYLTKS